MVGKANFQRVPLDLTKKNILHDKLLFGLGRQNASGVGSQVSNIGTGTGQSIAPVSGFLPVSGGVMFGPIALNPIAKNMTFSGGHGHLDVSSTGAFSGNVIVGNGGAHTLSYIDGDTWDGQELTIQGVATQTIPFDTVGNILPFDNVTYTLTGTEVVKFIFNATLAPNGNVGGWVQVTGKPSTGGGGGGGPTFPLTPNIHAHGSIGAVTEVIDWSLANAHVQTMTLTGDVTLNFTNPPAAGKNEQISIEVTQDGAGNHTITWPVTVNNSGGIVQGKSANQRTVYVAQTSNNGTSYDVFNTDMAATLSGLNFANTKLSNLDPTTAINSSLLFDTDAAYDIGSVTKRPSSVYSLQFGSSATRILDFSYASGIHYQVETGKKHVLTVNSVDIVEVKSDGFYLDNLAADPTNNGQFTLNGTDVKVFSGGAVRNLSNVTIYAKTDLSNLITTAINQDLIFGNGSSAQAKNITNVNQISWKTSGSPIKIATDGAGLIFDIFQNGYEVATLSNAVSGASPPNTGILEINGTGHTTYAGTIWVPSLKTVNNQASITNGDPIGGLYFDVFDSTAVRYTSSLIRGYADTNTHGSMDGTIHFFVQNAGTLTESMILYKTKLVSGATNTYDLGTSAINWKDAYLTTMRTHEPASSARYLVLSKDSTSKYATYNYVDATNTTQGHLFQVNSTSIYQITSNGLYPSSDNAFVLGDHTHRVTAANIVQLNDVSVAYFDVAFGNRAVANNGSGLTVGCNASESVFTLVNGSTKLEVNTDYTIFSNGTRYPVTTVTVGMSPYSQLTTDNIILVSGNTTINLLSATGKSGLTIAIIKTDSAATTVTINAAGIQKINGASSVTLTTQYSSYSLVTDGSNWYA